jgi:MOSC domain-containing protein YiiM/ferredoxin-NADP reductase
MARLLSVNVGLPRDIEWQGKTVHTAVWKTPVQGRRMTRRLNIDGDGQGDLAGHGGEHRAVFVYQIESYRYWQNQLGRNDFIYGQFGENFTVEGLADTEVCIGDHYRIGDALFEVTQPRVTCYRVGIRMNEPQMAALLVSHGRPGFYFRVLEEGEVGAGDEVVKIEASPERVTVAEINALLYLPGHPASGLERALRIPALSTGWRASLEALLDRERKGSATTGNPGLGPPMGPAPAWQGFRPLRVSRKLHESSDVTSLVLEPADGEPLTAALAGQFIVLRLRPGSDESALLRSYSLSGAPSEDRYRIRVKREPLGAGAAYIDMRVQTGDILDASAPRGSFTLQQGERPVALVSAGIGATPVLAMLQALAAERTRRAVWWIHGARNSSEHPFAAEVRELLKTLPGSRSHIRYSAPKPTDRPSVDFDKVGPRRRARVRGNGRPARCGLLHLRSSRVYERSRRRPCRLGNRPRAPAHREFRVGPVEDAGDRCGPAASAASAGGSRGGRAAGILYAQQSRCPLGFRLPQPARTGRGVRCAGALVVPHRSLS